MASAVDSAAERIGRHLLRRLQGGRLTVEQGGVRTRYGSQGGIEATIRVHDPSMWRSAILGGGVGFGEAYVEQRWDSEDLVQVLRLLARNIDRLNTLVRNPVIKLRTFVADRHSRPTEADDRRNIRAHYDLGNDFFKLFLDSTMAYSCALFERPGMSLEEAQLAKFDAIASRLGLSPDAHVVEIGTGWGGFAVHAARAYGCRVTTTTISDKQFDYATQLVRSLGLQDRVTVLHQHYRELRGTFSHLVSIEMIEAVDWRLHREFFHTVSRLLRPDGLAAIQAIVVDDREFERSKRWQDFIKRHIFPGGCLPSVAELLDTTRAATDLSLVDLRDLGASYAVTLRRWRDGLDSHRPEALALGLDDRFLRMWRYYFAYCEAGFAERRISDVQVVFAKPGWRGHLQDAWPSTLATSASSREATPSLSTG